MDEKLPTRRRKRERAKTPDGEISNSDRPVRRKALVIEAEGSGSDLHEVNEGVQVEKRVPSDNRKSGRKRVAFQNSASKLLSDINAGPEKREDSISDEKASKKTKTKRVPVNLEKSESDVEGKSSVRVDVRRNGRTIRREVLPLNERMLPTKSGSFGCEGCKYWKYCDEYDPECSTDTTKRAEGHEVKTHKIPSRGPKTADILIVLESPSAVDNHRGRLLSKTKFNDPYDTLMAYFAEAGIDEERIRVTSLLKCIPPAGRALTMQDAVPCSEFLSEEIQALKPKMIVPMGKAPLCALIGNPGSSILDFHGIPTMANVCGEDYKIFPLWTMGYVQIKDHLTPEYQQAFFDMAEFLEAKKLKKKKVKYQVCKTMDEVRERMAEVIESPKNSEHAFDIETDGLSAYRDHSVMTCFGFSSEEGDGFCVPLDHYQTPMELQENRSEIVGLLKQSLTRNDIVIAAHQAKFEQQWVISLLGFKPTNIVLDTMLYHYISDENSLHDLKSLAIRYTDMGDYDKELDTWIEKLKLDGHGDHRYDLIPLDVLGRYNAMDNDATKRLLNTLRKKLQDQNSGKLMNLAENVLPKMSEALMRMEYYGAKIDTEMAHKVDKDLGEIMEIEYKNILDFEEVREMLRDFDELALSTEYEKKKPAFDERHDKWEKAMEIRDPSKKPLKEPIWDEPELKIKPGEEFHTELKVRSTSQMQYLFYSILDYERQYNNKSKKDPKPLTTDKDALNLFVRQYNCEIARSILQWSASSKMKGDFCTKLIAHAESSKPEGYAHASFWPQGTVTGRLSSSGEYNGQQIPNKEDAVVKRLFVSRFDNGFVINADYSQLELRLGAIMSQDEVMLNAYLEGRDLHMITCCGMYGLTEDEYNNLDQHEQEYKRVAAKKVNFGIFYGIGPPGLWDLMAKDGILCTLDDCSNWIDSFYETYPSTGEYVEGLEEYLEKHHYIESMFGRRRRLAEVMSSQDSVVARAERQGVNFSIQSPGSDITQTSLILIDEALSDFESVPFLTVHDSIAIDCTAEEVHEVVTVAKNIMENMPDLGGKLWPSVDLDVLKAIPLRADFKVGRNWRDGVKDYHTEMDIIELCQKADEAQEKGDKAWTEKVAEITS